MSASVCCYHVVAQNMWQYHITTLVLLGANTVNHAVLVCNAGNVLCCGICHWMTGGYSRSLDVGKWMVLLLATDTQQPCSRRCYSAEEETRRNMEENANKESYAEMW